MPASPPAESLVLKISTEQTRWPISFRKLWKIRISECFPVQRGWVVKDTPLEAGDARAVGL